MESVTESSFFCHPHSSSSCHSSACSSLSHVHSSSSSSLSFVTSALFSCAVTSDLSSQSTRESVWVEEVVLVEDDEDEDESDEDLIQPSILGSSLPREESLQSDLFMFENSYSHHQDLPQSVSDESHEEDLQEVNEQEEDTEQEKEEQEEEDDPSSSEEDQLIGKDEEEQLTVDQSSLLNLSSLLNSVNHTTPMKHLRNALDPLMDLLLPSPPRHSLLGATSPTNHIENNSFDASVEEEDLLGGRVEQISKSIQEDSLKKSIKTELMGKNTRPFASISRSPLGDISNQNNQGCKIYKRQNFTHWSRQEVDEDLFEGAEGMEEESILSKMPSLYLRRSTTDYSACISGSSNFSNFDIMPHCGKDAIVQMKSIFPCFDSPRDAIKRLSPATLTDILNGKYSNNFAKLHIIDCRYPYEYEGGHLPGAINISSLEDINNLLFSSTSLSQPTHETVLIFHCEFSSERAPRTALHVRNLDRFMNSANYPYLHYPQVYILDGGYKNFFVQYPQLCDPPNCYIPMRNVIFKEELKKCQKTRYMDASSHSKHRHKIRAAPSLKRSYSVSTSCPSSTTLGNQRTNEFRRPLQPYLNLAEMLSSDASGDIFDQKDKFEAAGDDFFSSQPISPS